MDFLSVDPSESYFNSSSSSNPGHSVLDKDVGYFSSEALLSTCHCAVFNLGFSEKFPKEN